MNYDALLVVSFGGPEGMDDVIPFLENVLRGRNVPRERMLKVAKHYEMFGGVSPINQQNRNLIAALEAELERYGPRLPIYWGNRNWHPMLVDTVRRMTEDGVRNALAFVTSAYSSYSSCRQYLENIADAQAQVGPGAPRIEKLRQFYNHPLFIEANVAHVRAAWEQVSEAQLVFTAHSIPESMAGNRGYALPLAGPGGVIAPIGFVSDHMEIVYDLDFEAQNIAHELGMKMVRAATAGTHPSFVKMIRELMLERIDDAPARFVGSHGARIGLCAPGCCL